jgi:hypothetical protein
MSAKQKRPSVAALSVDALIDQFDSIPDMMTSLKANVSSPRRYSRKFINPDLVLTQAHIHLTLPPNVILHIQKLHT